MGIPALTCDDYQRQHPAAARALALHQELRSLLQESSAVTGLSLLEPAEIEAAWQTGRPVVERIQLGPRTEPLRQILRRVSDILTRHMPTLGPVGTLADPAKLDDDALLRLAQVAASSSVQVIADGVRATGAHPTGTAFALAFAVSVFYHAARHHLPADVDLSVWARQTCPVCAAVPSIARQTASRGREAYCHRCSSVWPVPADLCLACGTRDSHHRLRIEAPGDTARFVEVCRGCRQYTKVVDETRLGSVPDLYFEDVVTLPLDQLAREAIGRIEEPLLAGAR